MEIGLSYHIGVDPEYKAKYAIIPGDPGRVEEIASYLEEPHFLSQKREYLAWSGKIRGENVFVMSTGIGGPSTAIAVEELCKLGVDTFIRLGTCGGMQTNVESGDIVIATGAIRMEGTSKEYVPIEFPAVPNLECTCALAESAKNLGLRYHTGIVQCKDSFYGQHNPERMPVGYELKNKWNAWKAAGCLASEMESAALFTVASVLRVRAASLFTCVWNQERVNAGLPFTETHDNRNAIKTAVGAIEILIQNT